MEKFVLSCKNFTSHRWVKLIVASILFFTSIGEVYASFGEGIGAHHGLTLFSFYQLINVIPEFFIAAEHVGSTA